MGKLCGVCLCFYVSKVVGKWYLHRSGFLVFLLSFLGVWEFLFLVCVCSLLSVVSYTQISAVLLSPYMLCAWVHCNSCSCSLDMFTLCSVHCPLNFALCEFVHMLFSIANKHHHLAIYS